MKFFPAKFSIKLIIRVTSNPKRKTKTWPVDCVLKKIKTN